MWFNVILVVLHVLHLNVEALWDAHVCPMVCTCRLEHLRDTAIYRFMQKHKDSQPLAETNHHLNNDVLYDDDLTNEFLEDNPVLRAITCLLQTETDPAHLLEKLPKDTESLTLIQGAESGNKSIYFSQLQQFPQLIILELQGTNMMNEKNISNFLCEIDTPLHEIKYLNLDKVFIKASQKYLEKFDNEIHEEVVTFEYTQQLHPNLHPLTMVQRGAKEKILPYQKYVEEESKNGTPVFLGFNNLILLRISNCGLNHLNWEMFDGLQNLEYLLLEKNNLMFIPDFAFYGTPNIKSLSLAWNNLLNIQITDLAGLLELEYLDLSHNNFSQLSELSFPPFPKLKLANFGNNPISVVFPSTFEVMNTTYSLILGGDETSLALITNSFLGLKMLKKLTLQNLIVNLLKRELLVGMPNLNELIISGNISKLEFDAFLDVCKLEKLIATQCSLQNISMDAFIGLEQLQILDLSHNNLEYLPPGTLDPLINIKELYLNHNKFVQLQRDIFSQIRPKLIRLNENPWHCSCRMSDWKPMIINKIKHKYVKHCDFTQDKGIGCSLHNVYDIKYVFDTRVAPKCASPKKYVNWNIFHVMRKELKCLNYKPKIKKRFNYMQNRTFEHGTVETTSVSINHVMFQNLQVANDEIERNNTNDQTANDLYIHKINKLRIKEKKHSETEPSSNYNKQLPQNVPVKISLFTSEQSATNNEDNNIKYLHTNIHPPLIFESYGNFEGEHYHKTNKTKHNPHEHTRKLRKHKKHNNKSRHHINTTPQSSS